MWNTSNTFGSLSDGTTYSNGQSITGGGTVLDQGALTTKSHTGLSVNTTYYYKVYSYDCAKNYSTAQSANATTNSIGAPISFVATASSTCNIDLTWVHNGTNNVMIVYNTTNNFGTPFNGFPNYTPGMQVSNNHDTILYMGTANGTSHSPILDNTRYYYKAFSYDGNYYFSSGSDATDSTSLIQAPSNLTSAAQSTQIDLSWNLNTAGNEVIVLKNTTNSFGSLADGQTYVTGATLGAALGEVIYQGNATSFSDNGLAINTVYFYKVLSYDCAKNYSSGIFISDTTVVGISDPAAFAATAASSTEIDLSWTANSSSDSVIITYNTVNDFASPSDGTSYIIGNQIQSGRGRVLYKGDAVNNTSKIHTGLLPNTKYYYKIWSYDANTNYYSTPGILDSATTGFPGISTFPNITDFENQSPTATGNPSCSSPYYLVTQWVNVNGDDKDWIPRQGATPYSSTGPIGDHTRPGGTGKYVYTSGYGGGWCTNETAWLQSPLYNFTALTNPKLEFYYFMYGNTMGRLSVQVSTDGGTTWSNDIWYKQGEQQTSSSAPWGRADINLSAYGGMNNIKIRIVSLSGSSWKTDMAVDDIKVYEPTNMSITSIVTEQDTLPVFQAYTNQEVIRVKITTTGNLSPLTITKLDLSSLGTTSLSDISNAKIYYTANNPTFSVNQQFGSTLNTIGANFTIAGAKVLSEGDNYFWLSYDISPTAIIGNNVDASCNQVTINGSTYTPLITSPAAVKEIKGQVIVGPGNSSTYRGPVFPSYNAGVQESVYLAREIGTGSKEINKLEWLKVSGSNITDQISEINIYMKNSTDSVLSSGTYSLTGYTLVYHGPMPNNKVNGWLGVNFDNTFLYDGTSNIKVLVVQPRMSSSWYPSPYWSHSTLQYSRARGKSSNGSAITNLTPSLDRPDIKFEYVLPQPMVYLSAAASQPLLSDVAVGSTDQMILRVNVKTQYTGNPINVSSFNFNTNGTTSAADIANAKVYYTGSSNVFTTSSQFGTTISNPSGTFTVNSTQTLNAGNNYFWLVYDISASATIDNKIDASCGSITVNGLVKTPSPSSPAGNRTIKDYVIIGNGTNAANNQPLDAYRYHAWEGIYLQRELGAAKDLTSLAFYKLSGANISNDIKYITIYIKHTTDTVLTSGTYSTGGYTQVYSGDFTNNALSGWMEVSLDQNFAYNGTDNIEVLIVQNKGSYFTNYPYWAYTTVSSNRARYKSNWSSQVSNLDASNRLANIRFGYSLPSPMLYVSSTTTQNNITNITAGISDQEILGVEINTAGSANPVGVSSFTFNTTGSSNAAADISSAKVYYSGLSSSFSTAHQFGSIVANPNGTFTVTGSQNLEMGVNYFWLVYDVPSSATTGDWLDAQCTSITIAGVAHTPTITSPLGNRTIVSALSGYYTIGATGDYSSFNAAVSALNTYGIAGWVTFRVQSGTYNEKVNLIAVNNAAANRLITFESLSGDSTDVVLTYNSATYSDAATLKIIGGKYFVIRNMTIKNTATNYSHAIEIAGNSKYNTIRNNVLSTNLTNSEVIYTYDASNSYTRIIQNRIDAKETGIYIYGSGGVYNSNWTIDSNSITATDYGIDLYYASNIKLRNNSIKVNTSSSTCYGIYSRLINGSVEISANKLQTSSSYIAYGLYLRNAVGISTNRIKVFNNFIANNSNVSNASVGILSYSSDYVDFSFNNVNITSTSGTTKAAMYVYSSSNIRIRDNNFTAPGGGYAQYYYGAGQVTVSDYNNMYSTGDIGYYNGSKSNLSLWQSASSMDANSMSVNPNYISDIDLHISNAALDNKGIPIAGITKDIDGNVRNTSTPDIGADEFGVDVDAGILAIVSPVSPLCGIGNHEVRVSIKNYGNSTLSNASINWKVGGIMQTAYAWSGNLISGTTETVSLGNYSFVSGSQTIEAWTSNPNGMADQYGANDSANATIIVGQTPTAFAGNDTSVCANAFVLSGDTATYYDNLSWTTTGSGSFNNGSILHDTYNPSTADYSTGNVQLILTAVSTSCGSVSDTMNLTIAKPSVVSFTGLVSHYCSSDAVDTLVGSPSGGVFTGIGINGNLFDPANATLGNNTIKYIYSAGLCSDSAMLTTTVNSTPVVNLSGLNSTYCNNDAAVSLTGSPSGGAYGGDGVVGNTFDPSQVVSSPVRVWYSYTDANSACSAADTQLVVVNDAPVVNAGVDQNITIGTSTTLTGSASGGTASYAYVWSPSSLIASGVNSATATTTSLLFTTTYTLDVTDNGNSCSADDQMVVTVGNPFIMFVTAVATPDTVCAGDSIHLQATVNGGTAPYTYSWISMPAAFTSAEANPWTHPAQSAWYKVSVTDGTLSAKDSVYVVVKPSPNVSFSGLPSAICSNADSVLLTPNPTMGVFNGSGIIGEYFYPSNVGAGTYDIIYSYTSANSCSGADTQTVVVEAAPLADAGIDQNITSGSSAALSGSASGGSGSYAFAWSPITKIASGVNSAGATTIPLSSAALFTLKVTDNVNSCYDNDTVLITVGSSTLAVIASSSPDTICSGASSQLSASVAGGSGTYSYSWTSSPAGFSSTISNPVITPGITTTYTLDVSDGVTNASSATVVVVNPNPIADAGTDKTIALGSSTMLNGSASNGSGTYTYVWTPTADLVNANIQNPTTISLFTNTTFVLTVEDVTTSCTGTDSMHVFVTNTALTAVPTATPDTICKGSSTQLLANAIGGSGTYTYNWTSVPVGFTSSVNNPTVMPNVTTMYYLVVNDGSSTVNDSVKVVVNSIPNASFFGLNSDYCNTSSPVTLVGSPAGGIFSGPGISANQFNPSMANTGNNQIIYTASNGNCIDRDTQFVNVHITPIANAGTDQIISGPASTTLNGSYTGGNNVGYFWSPTNLLLNSTIATPTTVSLNATTIYTLETKDTVNNCSSTDQVTITVTNVTLSVTANATPSTVCAGDTVDLQAVGSGGSSGNYSFLWSSTPVGFISTAASVKAQPIVNTTYTVRIIDGNDTAYTTTSVIVNALPNVSFIGLSAGYCDNASAVSLVGTPAGGLFSGPGIVANQFNPSQANIGTNDIVYTATVNSCSNSDTQQVIIYETPVANAGTDILLSAAGSTSLSGSYSGGANVGFYWTPVNKLINANMANPTTVILSGSQVFTLETKDTVNQCFSTDQMTVVVAGGNLSITASASPTSLCEGDTSHISTLVSGGNGTYSYNWSSTPAGFSSSLANVDVSPTVTTTYTVVVNSGASVNNATVVVNVNPLPTVSFVGLSSPVCANSSSMTLSGIPSGGTFGGTGVSMNAGNYIFDPSVAGVGSWGVVYNYTNPNTACSNADTQWVAVNSVPVVDAGSDQTVVGPIAVSLSGNASGAANYKYLWTPTALVINPTLANTQTTVLSSSKNFTLSVTDSVTNCVSSDDVLINVGSANPVSVVASSGASSICNGSNTQLNAIASGGNPPYTYTWTSAPAGFTSTISNPTVNPTLTTVYNVVVSDGNTSASASVTITVNATPTISFSGLDTVNCNNGLKDTLTGIPSGGFFSGDGISANIFNPVVAGQGYHSIIYSYTSSNGCTATDTQLTHVYSAPLADAGSDFAITAPSTATLSGSASGGTANYNYSWSPASLFTNPNLQTLTTANNLATTTQFTLQVEDATSLCKNSDNVIVTVHGGPLTLNPMATPDTICVGQQVQLSAMAGGGSGNYMFAWSSIPSGYIQLVANPVASPVVTTTYIVNIFDGVHTLSDTVVVYVGQIPNVNIISTKTNYCSNGINDTLLVSPLGGIFYGNGMSSTIFSPSNAGVGTHQLVYQYTSSYGCSNADTINVMVKGAPMADAGSDISIPCSGVGGLIGSNPVANMIYQWSPTASLVHPDWSNTVANPSQSTLYTLLVTDTISACSNTDQVQVTVTGGPSLTVANDTMICGGQSVNVYASGTATSYQWSNGVSSTAFTVAPNQTTTYTVTATDASTCAVVDSVVVTVHAPYVFLGPDINVIDTMSTILDAGFGFSHYSWNTGDTIQSIVVSPYVNAQLGLNKYTVRVSDAYGCTAMDSIMINYMLNINSLHADFHFDLFPNPSKGKFIVEIKGTVLQNYSLDIVNMQGSIVLRKQIYVNKGQFRKSFDFSNWSKGVYFIRIYNNQFISTKKLIIQ